MSQRQLDLIAAYGPYTEEILILFEGWESDNAAWILPDGRVIHTNHGNFYEVDWSFIDEKIQEAERSLAGLQRAKHELNRFFMSKAYAVAAMDQAFPEPRSLSDG